MTSSSAHARLLAKLSAAAGAEALVFEGRSFTFGALDDLSRRYARALAARGVGRGDRVAVIAESTPEVVVALLGHYRLGAVHVPVNARYRAEEAGHVLRDSGACAALVDAAGAEVLGEVGPLPDLRLRVALGGGASAGAVAFGALLEGPPGNEPPPPPDEDAALLVYTSGTTGRSKGVELSYRALAGNVGALAALWRIAADDRIVLALPLFHVHGLAIGLHAMLLEGAAVLLQPRFDAARVVEAFAREGATLFLGVPTMYVKLLEEIGRRPEAAAALSRGRLFTSGSAPLSAGDFRAFEERTGHRILERYGMTETLFTLSNPREGERRPGTVGLPVPGCEIRVADEAGGEAAPGELGEILVRSNGIMNGYRGRPADTAAAFRDGWFATGDVARRAADGYVTIEGRSSVDLIKSGGFKIAAREIEEVLRRHPLVKDVAVVGVADRVWGERVEAAVVLRPGAAIGEAALLEELAAFTAKHLADYKRPRGVMLLDELPRNALGKVQKHLLGRR